MVELADYSYVEPLFIFVVIGILVIDFICNLISYYIRKKKGQHVVKPMPHESHNQIE